MSEELNGQYVKIENDKENESEFENVNVNGEQDLPTKIEEISRLIEYETNDALKQENNNSQKTETEPEVNSQQQTPSSANDETPKALLILKKTLLFLWLLLLNLLKLIYTPKKLIRNKVVLITGSGSPLGRQLACEFSKQGLTLLLWDENEEENQKTYDALRALKHRRMYLYKVDFTNEQQIIEIASQCKTKFHNIALIAQLHSISLDTDSIIEAAHSTTQLTNVIKANYQSNVIIYQQLLPQMIQNNDGHLVVVSTDTAILNNENNNIQSSLEIAKAKLLESVDFELNLNEKNQIRSSIVYLGSRKDEQKESLEYEAHQIVRGVLWNQKYIYLPKSVFWIELMKNLLPSQCYEVLFRKTTQPKTKSVDDSKKQD